MAALQQTPITIKSRSPLPTQFTVGKAPKLSFSGHFTFPKLTLKLAVKPRRHGIRMADSPSTSYATALADVANSNGTLEDTVSELETVEKIFSDTEVFGFFTNPTIDLSKKREVLDELCKSTNFQPHTSNFLNILVDMNRIDLVTEIIKEFELVYNRLTDTELAIVTSVVKLESQHLAQIAKGVQKLTGSKNVRIKTAIDPNLVAGFTIRYGNGGSKLIDMSVKKQLEEIAASLDLGDVQLAV